MKDRIRIYCISYKFAPVVGGAEARAEKHARQLQALGHDVTVITLRLHRSWRRTELLDGLPVVRVGGKYRRDGQLRLGKFGHLFIATGVLLFLWRERHRFDIIHAFQLAPPSVVAALLSHIARKPIIVSIQNAGPDENQLAQFQSREGDPRVGAYGLQVDAKEDWAIRPPAQVACALPGSQHALPFLSRFNGLSRRTDRRYSRVREYGAIPGSAGGVSRSCRSGAQHHLRSAPGVCQGDRCAPACLGADDACPPCLAGRSEARTPPGGRRQVQGAA